tara:strand:+ start:533 stop:1207 length:675 start_codon:yes stop_codon:yes gene_type:complete
MINSHWTCYGTEKSFVPNEDKFGFVYIITNTKNGKAYVGCKQYYIGKSKKQSKWQTYMGSSKYLKADIKKIGKKYFTFEVIAEYKNKRSLRYYEMYYQVKWNVLTSTIEGTDEPAFYNSYVGGKFYRPVESYIPHTEETKRKQSEVHRGVKHPKYKGKYEFYLDDKKMVVDCLSVWCDENGYAKSNVTRIGLTHEKPERKDKAFSCNGPLGIITNVKKYIDNEE